MLITTITEFKNNMEKYLTLAEKEDILISKTKRNNVKQVNLKSMNVANKNRKKKKEMTQEEYHKFLDDLWGSIDDPTMVEPPDISWEYDTERIEIE